MAESMSDYPEVPIKPSLVYGGLTRLELGVEIGSIELKQNDLLNWHEASIDYLTVLMHSPYLRKKIILDPFFDDKFL